MDPKSPAVQNARKMCGKKLNFPAWRIAGTGPPGDVVVTSAGTQIATDVPHLAPEYTPRAAGTEVPVQDGNGGFQMAEVSARRVTAIAVIAAIGASGVAVFATSALIASQGTRRQQYLSSRTSPALPCRLIGAESQVTPRSHV